MQVRKSDVDSFSDILLDTITCRMFLLLGIRDWKLPQGVLNQVCKHYGWLSEDVYSVLEIGTMGRDLSWWYAGDWVFGSFPLVASSLDRILCKRIDQGDGWQTFSTFCNQTVCSRLLSRAQKEIFQILPEVLSLWSWPIKKLVQLPHIVIDIIQSPKSSAPKSLCCRWKGSCSGNIICIFSLTIIVI